MVSKQMFMKERKKNVVMSMNTRVQSMRRTGVESY